MRAITISNKNKKLIGDLFAIYKKGVLVGGFIKITIDRNSEMDAGEVRMWCNVIKSGFMTLDYNFMLSGSCKSICDSLLLDYEYVIAAFLKIEGLIFKELKGCE